MASRKVTLTESVEETKELGRGKCMLGLPDLFPRKCCSVRSVWWWCLLSGPSSTLLSLLILSFYHFLQPSFSPVLPPLLLLLLLLFSAIIYCLSTQARHPNCVLVGLIFPPSPSLPFFPLPIPTFCCLRHVWSGGGGGMMSPFLCIVSLLPSHKLTLTSLSLPLILGVSP